MALIRFVSRNQGELIKRNLSNNLVAIDVSSDGLYPYNLFSPDTHSPKIQIPVPGMEEEFAESVEGIWQGLKVINGEIDRYLFHGKPHKREGQEGGHMYKGNILRLEEARWSIYIPTYKFYLDHYVPEEVISSILIEQRSGKKVFVYDVNDNGDIRNPQPLAHAAVLATHLNLKIFNQSYSPLNEEERQLVLILDDPGLTLEEKVASIAPLLQDPAFRKSFRYRCVEHPFNIDDFHIAEAMGDV